MSPLKEDAIKIIIAAIPGVVALVLACINYIVTKKNQERLETFKATLAEQKADKDAFRDYKYEARKRLYQEIEPLFFQLGEASEQALHRIYGLARTARAGDLRQEDGWLSREGYYAISTMYKLILPIAIIKVIQQRLTLVDLAVDPDINAQYILAKGLYISFTDDFVFANMEPLLPYDPNRKDWMEKRADHPEKYTRQGIPLGHLDNAADALIKHEGPGQWVTFGDFYAMYKNKIPEVYEKFDPIATVILYHHPKTRPVFWRMLVTQAHIYQALLRCREMHMRPAADVKPLMLPIETEGRSQFDWRHSEEVVTEREAQVDPFEIARQYLHKRMGELFLPPDWKSEINS